MKWYLAACLLTFPILCTSGATTYECNIAGEYIHSKNGKLKPDEKVYFGKRFHVERSTGVVLGGGVGNSSYPVRQVLDPGSKEQAFKLVSVSRDVAGTKAGKNVIYLSISEYDEGPSKTFVLVEGSRILTGTCE